jgi:hypothetical protein
VAHERNAVHVGSCIQGDVGLAIVHGADFYEIDFHGRKP